MKLDIKKLLLAGTAIVAVGATSVTAQAADLTLTQNSTWGTTAPVNAPTAADNVNLDGFDLTVNEGNVTAIGAITDTNATPDGNVTFDSNAGDNASTAVTVASATLGSGNFVVQATEAGAGNADATAVTVSGAISTTGNVTVTAGAANAGDHATLTVGGNISAAAITVTDSAGAATLVLNGAAAQTIAGAVSGDGDITISNTHASGVTFTGANTGTGTITMNTAATDQAVTFTGNVGSAISLGDNTDTDTKTATFGGAADTTISGAIAGGGAADTVALNFVGGKIVTLSGLATSNIDTVSVSGNTTLDSDAAITATTITIASGSTLDQGAGAIGAAIANSGTIKSTAGAATITGDITGTGALDIDAAQQIDGSITQATADVAAVTLINNTGTVYNVGTTTFSADGTVAFDNAVRTITGNFTNTTDGEGTITIANGANTTTIVGDLGASASNSLKALTSDASLVTTTGNLYVDAITLNDADTLSFIGTSAQTVSGTINNGDINVGTGATASDVTFMSAITSGDALTVNDTAKATFAADAAFGGALSADKATIAVKSGATLTANTQVDADITTWNVEVSRAGGDANNSTGKVVLSNDAVNLAVDTVHFDVKANSAPLVVGASKLDDVFAGNNPATIAGATVTDSSFIYGFELVADTNAVDVTVTIDNSVENVTENSGYDATGNQLITTLSASTNTEINQLQSTLAAASTKSAANNVIEAAASDVGGGAVAAGVQVAGSTSAINNDRLASLRSGETGMNAGQVMHGLNGWIQGFGSQADQDKRDGVSGYDADTYGFAIGFDTEELSQNSTVGLSFAYADTDVDSDAISNAKTEVDSYQISLYGDYDVNETVFVSGQLGYIWSDNDTTRNPGGIAALNAKGSYNADAFVAGLAVGRDYHTGHGTLVLTPKVSADYMHYSADSYTETGAGGANLTVDADSLNMFEIGLGVEAEWDIQNANGSHLMPSIGLGVRHDLIGDEFEASNTFAGGGSAFKVKGFDPAQTTFDAGLGVKYITDTNWTLSAGYDFEFKSDYSAHAGMVKASYKF